MSKFVLELAYLINKYNLETGSNTSEYVLADN